MESDSAQSWASLVRVTHRSLPHLLPLCLSGVPGPQIHPGVGGPVQSVSFKRREEATFLTEDTWEKRASKFEDCLLKVLQGALASL